nr:class D beta-lactamase [Lichenihabitans psoromatis]
MTWLGLTWLRVIWLGLALSIGVASVPASATTLCTVVADAADGKVLLEQGDCRTRVTPASTFKIPLSVMGFDSGVVQDAHTPVYTFKQGDPDWGGEAWKQPTDPTRWLKYSVVWYSQRVMHQLGAARVTDYASRFGFGNADVSGDPGRDNGLDRSWIMSSLKVSPVEQIAFLRHLVNHDLPVTPTAIDKTMQIVEATPAPDGWTAHGKTGAAFPRNPDGSFNEARGYGWYVGWIEKAGRKLVFARLDQDDQKQASTPGVRARDSFIGGWPALATSLKL